MTLDLAGMRKAAMDGVASEDKGTVLFIKPTIVLALLDEIERWHRDYDKTVNELEREREWTEKAMREIERLRAENDSMRRALKDIADSHYVMINLPLKERARAALAARQQEQKP